MLSERFSSHSEFHPDYSVWLGETRQGAWTRELALARLEKKVTVNSNHGDGSGGDNSRSQVWYKCFTLIYSIN